jgi:hypothetical protein
MRRNAQANAAAARPQQYRKEAEATARQGRSIQREIDQTDNRKGKGKSKPRAMQAGARIYPVPPLSKQHLRKPGLEADLELKPMYDAPHYKGSEKLLDKAALITGGDSGIGRAVAVLFAREGADVAIVYLNEHEPKLSAPSRRKGAAASYYREMLPIRISVRPRWQKQLRSSASSTSW